MLKATKYRIYPTKKQATLADKHIGACRFLYNLALETKNTAYIGNKVNLSRYDLQVQLKDLKNECTWLKEINSQSLQVSLMNLDGAFLKFFKGQNDFPKFKKKSSKQSFNIPQNVTIENGKLVIPKFKEGINIVLHREIKGTIRQATINKTPTGKYFVSILSETVKEAPKKKPITEKTAVGGDVGIKTFLVTSDGKEFANPKHLIKAQSKLQFTQRKYSKHKGKRTKQKLAIVHEKVANQRNDFLHKTSTTAINSHDTMCLEDLNISGMMKRCKPKQDEDGKYLPNGQAAKSGLNKSIADAGWGKFVSMLEYKAEWYGKNILRIGRFEASSKTCSCCGKIKKDLTLEDRVFNCDSCGLSICRDLNAAINIKNFALIHHLSVGRRLKNRNELPTLVGVLTYEAPSPLGKG